MINGGSRFWDVAGSAAQVRPLNVERRNAIRAMFVADWRDALFIHFRADARRLQRMAPLPLDLRGGDAYVSLVAFAQHRLRPAIGGAAMEFLSRPLANHEFLNLRTYVVHDGEPGIYFINEWIPNRLAVFLGPRLYGLPYKFAELSYRTGRGYAARRVIAGGKFWCEASWDPEDSAICCAVNSESEFLLERYTAFTHRHGRIRRFRIAHEPWPAVRAEISIDRRDLLGEVPIGEACLAHYSPGVCDVRISPPAKVFKESAAQVQRLNKMRDFGGHPWGGSAR